MRKVKVDNKEDAFFHGFFLDAEEGPTLIWQFPVAIIEFPDGHVETVRPERIRFLTPPTE